MLIPNSEIPDASLNELTSTGDFSSSAKTILGTLDPEGKEFLFKSEQNALAHCNNSFYFTPIGPDADLSISIPTIIQAIRREESVIVFSDCTRTIIRYTNNYAKQQGYTTRYINFNVPDTSHGIDLLSAIQNDPFRARVIASTIMANTNMTVEHDIHEALEALEKDLLTALLLFVSAAPSEWIAPEAKGLTAILNILKQTPETMDSLFSLGKGDPQFQAAWEAYSSHRQGNERLRCAIMNSLGNRLQHIADPQYSGLCAADVDITLPAKEKCIFYINPPNTEKLKPLCASLLQIILLDLEKQASCQLTGLPVVPVNILINNPCDIGILPHLEYSLSPLLGRNIPITFMVPSKLTLEELYGKTVVAGMIEGCSIVGCLYPRGETYRSFLSWYKEESESFAFDMIRKMHLFYNRYMSNKLLLFWRRIGWKIVFPIDIEKFQAHGEWYQQDTPYDGRH